MTLLGVAIKTAIDEEFSIISPTSMFVCTVPVHSFDVCLCVCVCVCVLERAGERGEEVAWPPFGRLCKFPYSEFGDIRPPKNKSAGCFMQLNARTG